jgi:large subunit ribosomal protein L10
VNRAEKTAVVEGMREGFEKTPHLILTSFRGLTVNQATALRRKIRGVGGSYKVVKNRLAKRAAGGTGVEFLIQNLSGPCALAGHESDPVALAKALSEFAKENPQLELLAGLVDAREVIDPGGVKQLATLPGLPELRAKLLALIQTPATSLLRLIATPGTQLARVVDARNDSLGGADAKQEDGG